MATVADIGLARLSSLEDQIGAASTAALRARWEFGHELVAARDGKGRLPNGYLARVVEQTGASRRELAYRAQFAESFATQQELCNAVAEFGSWHAIVRDALPTHTEAVKATEPAPLPAGTFRTIVADPPWQYGNKSTRGAAEDHYPTMTMEELADLDVGAHAAGESHLYLWVTNNFLREGFDLLDAWGFEYKTMLTWAKTQIGLGNYFRGATEHILFGVRGGLRTEARDIRNWFEAPRGKHSAKPDCFYDLVEKASPGPYLEMFARRARLGDWSFWGDQALQDTEVLSAAA